MAQVTSYTASEVEEIEGHSIVSATINQSTKHLVLSRSNGETVDAGQVVPDIPVAPTPPPVLSAWPVGSIFMSISATSPATTLGGGTWVRWGKGRVPVSLDEAQGEFDSVEELGGEKTHTLSNAEMPAHSHGGGTGGQNADHVHAYQYYVAGAVSSSGSLNVARTQFNGNTGGASSDHAHGIATDGGNAAHNNLQPYITCYMWKRTA